MFCQVNVGKGTTPEHAEQLVIAKDLSHTFSHTVVLSKRKNANTQRIWVGITITRACFMHIITYPWSCRINAPRSMFSWMRSESMMILRRTRHFLFHLFVSTFLDLR